jgi:hypothetical protein
MEIHVDIIQDIPLPMAEDFHSKNYVAVESSRFLSQIEIECLTQSMESALKRAGQDTRKRRKSRIFRCYNPSLEEIKEHSDEELWQKPVVDLTSMHKERAMNEGHFGRGSRRRSRGSKQDRN